MHTPKLAIVLALAMAAAMANLSQAQNSPQDYLSPHNAARAAVGVGAVSWSTKLQGFAQSYANQRMNDCKLQHSGGPYGENIFWGSGQSWTAADAVKLWVDEKQNYHLDSNTCDAGKVCGHYTQVVWRKSTRIGCARVVCAGNRGVFITCNYDPPGNFNGERPFAFLTLDAQAK
uniref:Putative pathogenesis-related protein PR1a n=1 Tax=Secale cereale TaxID=4550 RepID=A0A2U9K6N0_SECCE|nr:putative pathogenesis-related protein PR1a [Secale cereale]